METTDFEVNNNSKNNLPGLVELNKILELKPNNFETFEFIESSLADYEACVTQLKRHKKKFMRINKYKRKFFFHSSFLPNSSSSKRSGGLFLALKSM